ncbi:hypothetical protein TRFO_17825 [Tritrichomonas foetus]|uniref:Chromo domain-containing protein n=1 Tax=Tritrichomonas foetus TaxID=1144522 RepID=A0A1J4KRQ4_9EUKA|nr:hypothetical protein TRFO_17825 [Tritrichomonas foetus]|eukprot:OHT12350.1 hypothetical protein TRFO_17825 [Tritrichomonas foetus]
MHLKNIFTISKMSKKKATTSEQKETTAELPPSPYERILSCRTNAKGAPECYVKLRGKSYRDSKWISNDELSQNPQTSSMLTRFLRNQREYAMNPPFYDPQFDIIDRIIAKKGKKYLVKWMGLGYDQITWEKDVTPEALEDYQARQLQNYPIAAGDVFKKPDLNIQNIASYSLGDTVLESYQVSTMNLLIRNFSKLQSTDIVDRYNTPLITSCAAFIEYVLQNSEERGPILIVSPFNSISKWYNIFREIKCATTLSYTGTKEARQAAVEHDYSCPKKKLKFHVLITTPDILSHDLEMLAEIKWRIAIFDEAKRLKDPQSKLAKVLQRYVIGTQVALMQSQTNIFCLQKLTDLLISSCTDKFVSEDLKKAAQIARSRIQPKLLKRKNQMNDDKDTYSTYYIDCPLSAIQKKVLRKVIHDAARFVQRKNFIPICQRILRICSHPFLLYSQEYTMQDVDFISSSTKLATLEELLIENVKQNERILIISDFSLMLDMIEDVANNHAFSFERIVTQSKDIQRDDAQIFLYNPKYCTIASSVFETMNAIVVVDGDGSELQKLLQNNRPHHLHKIFKFQCRDCSESVLNNICIYNPNVQPDNERCENICKLSALAAFSDKSTPDPKVLLQKATVVTNSFNPNESLEKEFQECDFWSYLVDEDKTLKNPKSFSSTELVDIIDDESAPHVWTKRERDQLLRGLCRFGFDRWRELIIQTGLRVSVQSAIKASRALLREMIRYIGSGTGHAVTKEFIKESSSMEEEDEVADKEFINKSVFNDVTFKTSLQKNSVSYLKEIEMLHFLGENLKDKTDIYEVSVPHPSGALPQWWKDDYDRYLAFATWKYGLGCYEQFFDDSNKEILKIFGPADDPIEYRDLNERVLKLAEAIKRKQGVNQLGISNTENYEKNSYSNENLKKSKKEVTSKKENDKKKTNSSSTSSSSFSASNATAEYGGSNSQKWTREEIRDMFQYILKFGIPEDTNGQPDYERFGRESNLCRTRTTEQVQVYVEDYIRRCKLTQEEGGIPPGTSSRVNQRCSAMKQLREILRDENTAKRVFENSTHWRFLPREWRPEHELYYFSETLRLGFGSFQDILSGSKFTGVFPNNEPPAFLSKEPIVMKRIHYLFDFLQNEKKGLPTLPSSSKRKSTSSSSNSSSSTSKTTSSSSRKAKSSTSAKVSSTSSSGTCSGSRRKGRPPEGFVLQQNGKLFPSDRAIFDGRVNYPLNIGNNKLILNLGEIGFDKLNFQSDRYLYPIGYKVSSRNPSAIEPNTEAVWINEITCDENSRPIFKAWMENNASHIYEGNSANAVWTYISADISNVNNGQKFALSGLDAFLLTDPIVTYLIQNMKGTKRCAKYKAKKINIPPEALKLRDWIPAEKVDTEKSTALQKKRNPKSSKNSSRKKEIEEDATDSSTEIEIEEEEEEITEYEEEEIVEYEEDEEKEEASTQD